MVDFRPGDVWIAENGVKDLLSIPDGRGGRKPFTVPKNSCFTLIKRDTTHPYARDPWWVITFNGFSLWTSIETLAEENYITLMSRVNTEDLT